MSMTTHQEYKGLYPAGEKDRTVVILDGFSAEAGQDLLALRGVKPEDFGDVAVGAIFDVERGASHFPVSVTVPGREEPIDVLNPWYRSSGK